MPFHPDIQTYRQDRRRAMLTPPSRRGFFMGRNFFDQLHEEAAPLNVKKAEDGFTLEIGLPGFSKDQIEVSVADDVLTVRASKQEEHADKGEYLIQEMHTESVERRLTLPAGMGKEDIQAKFENGMLRLKILDVPEEREQAKKTIPVE